MSVMGIALDESGNLLHVCCPFSLGNEKSLKLFEQGTIWSELCLVG